MATAAEGANPWEDEHRWLDEAPSTPRSVKVHYSRTDHAGRLEQTAINVPLPPHCNVATLLDMLCAGGRRPSFEPVGCCEPSPVAARPPRTHVASRLYACRTLADAWSHGSK